MYPILQEEIARQARRDLELRSRLNAADAHTRVLGARSAPPAGVRRALGKGFVRAGLALLGGGAALRFTDEESAATR